MVGNVGENLQVRINALRVVQCERNREVGLLVAVELEVVQVASPNESVVNRVKDLKQTVSGQ